MFRKKKRKGTSSTQNSTQKSLIKTIDGYEGYEGKNERKDTDEALRVYLHSIITDLYDEFSKVANQLMQAQILSAWQAANMIMKEIQSLRSFLSEDKYRHSTFFDANDVSSVIEISVIYIIESEIILTINACKQIAIQIHDDILNVNMENIERNVMKLKRNINGFSRSIRDRAELIASFEIVGI